MTTSYVVCAIILFVAANDIIILRYIKLIYMRFSTLKESGTQIAAAIFYSKPYPHKGGTELGIRYAFEAPAGKIHKGKTSIAYSPQLAEKYSVGNAIPVLYLPDDAHINGANEGIDKRIAEFSALLRFFPYIVILQLIVILLAMLIL